MNSNKWNGLPTVIMGTGGISREVKCIIEDINLYNNTEIYNLLGYIGKTEEELGSVLEGVPVIAYDNNLEELFNKYPILGVVLPMGTPKLKYEIYEMKLKRYKNLVYPNIIHPKAAIINKKLLRLGYGNIICAGATLTTNISLGNFNLINVSSVVGHDVVIEDYCVINPLTSVSGSVHIESLSLIGAGATILQGVTIGDNSIIGLGAFVVKDVKSGSKMICSPAKEFKEVIK